MMFDADCFKKVNFFKLLWIKAICTKQSYEDFSSKTKTSYYDYKGCRYVTEVIDIGSPPPWFTFSRNQKKSNVFYSSAWTGIVSKEEIAEKERFAVLAGIVASNIDKSLEEEFLYGKPLVDGSPVRGKSPLDVWNGPYDGIAIRATEGFTDRLKALLEEKS